MHLLAEYLVPDFLPVPSVVGPSSQHQFVGNYSHCVVVNRKRVVLPAHHLRSHVARSPAGVCRIVGLDESSNAEIGGSEVALVVKDQVFRFDVPMDDVVEVQVLEAHQDAGDEELCLHLLKPSPAAHVVAQVPADQQVHDQVEVFPVLKGVGHVDQEGVLQPRQQFPLVEHRMDAFLADNLGLVHLLHRVHLLSLLQLHAPHLPEPALAHHVLAVKVVPVHLLALQHQSLPRLLALELRQVNFETVLYVLVGLLGDSGVAAVVLLLPALRVLALLVLGVMVLLSGASGRNSRVAVYAHFAD